MIDVMHLLTQAVVSEHVTPLLDKLGQHYRIWTTTAPKHAGTIAREILSATEDSPSDNPIRVIVAGGDGTAHELVEGALGRDSSSRIKWELIILPLGTVSNHIFMTGPLLNSAG